MTGAPPASYIFLTHQGRLLSTIFFGLKID